MEIDRSNYRDSLQQEESAAPESASQRFEATYGRFQFAEEVGPDGEQVGRAFEFIIDPTDSRDRRMLVQFALRAEALGHVQIAPPLTVHGIGFREPNGEQRLDAYYFFLSSTPHDEAKRRPTEPPAPPHARYSP